MKRAPADRLDSTDLYLLELLDSDDDQPPPRVSMRTLADALGLSLTTVRTRLERLRCQGRVVVWVEAHGRLVWQLAPVFVACATGRAA